MLIEHIFEPLDPVVGADRLFMFSSGGKDFGPGSSESYKTLMVLILVFTI